MSDKDSIEEMEEREEALASEDSQIEEQTENPEEEETGEGTKLSREEELENELEKEKDKFLRLFAEFENFKRRTSKERMELFKTAGQEIMVSMLPVLDDFERALKEIGKSTDKELFKGVELIHHKFKDTLKAKGLEEIAIKEGDAFDAEVHDAITQIPAPNKKLKGKIIDVVEKGYRLGDKIIRHPKVVVGN